MDVPSQHTQPTSTRLMNRSYLALLATQFFGAANDNVLKQCLIFMVATGLWSGDKFGWNSLGPGGQVVPTLCLTVPFIFLSGYAGQICDRYSKRRVIFWVKLIEIPIACLAMVGFFTHSLWLTILAMLLLSIQSSFFGPAKYGVIPEIVREEHLSMANGVINMCTNLAVIIGSLVAGPLSGLFYPEEVDGVRPPGVAWAPGAALVLVAVLGLLSCLPFPKLQPANPHLKFDWNPFATYWQAIKDMSQGPLLAVVLAWAAFYMIAMIALLILPEYQAILTISYTKTSYLLGILGVAIAIGSVTTGKISGSHIRPKLIPIGAAGMSLAFFLLGVVPPTFANVAGFVFMAGFFAGFYIVPLQALIQALSPADERGRIIGTSGAISFCFSSLGPVIFWVAFNAIMHFGSYEEGVVPAHRIFLICAAMSLAGTIYGSLQLRKMLAHAPAT